MEVMAVASRNAALLVSAKVAEAAAAKVLTPRTNVARSKSGVFGRNIMYFIRGTSDHPIAMGLGAPCPIRILLRARR